MALGVLSGRIGLIIGMPSERPRNIKMTAMTAVPIGRALLTYF